MFSKLADQLSTFAEHHQVLITLIVAFSVICISWGIEKILEEYIFPHKPLRGYVGTIVIGLMILWLTKYVVLYGV